MAHVVTLPDVSFADHTVVGRICDTLDMYDEFLTFFPGPHFAYDWRDDLGKTVDYLDVFMRDMKAKYTNTKFIMIGHGMGGIILHQYLADICSMMLPRHGTNFDTGDLYHAVFACTPFIGSMGAAVALFESLTLPFLFNGTVSTAISRCPSVYCTLPIDKDIHISTADGSNIRMKCIEFMDVYGNRFNTTDFKSIHAARMFIGRRRSAVDIKDRYASTNVVGSTPTMLEWGAVIGVTFDELSNTFVIHRCDKTETDGIVSATETQRIGMQTRKFKIDHQGMLNSNQFVAFVTALQTPNLTKDGFQAVLDNVPAISALGETTCAPNYVYENHVSDNGYVLGWKDISILSIEFPFFAVRSTGQLRGHIVFINNVAMDGVPSKLIWFGTNGTHVQEIYFAPMLVKNVPHCRSMTTNIAVIIDIDRRMIALGFIEPVLTFLAR